jgi:HlyD family secretion protein
VSNQRNRPFRLMRTLFLVLNRTVVLLGLTASVACSSAASTSALDTADTVRVTRRTFSRVLRLTGLVEAALSTTFTVPRMQGPLQQQGPGAGVLVVTRLAPGGGMVKAGDIIVQFDPQSQERIAFERRSEYEDFVAQLSRKEAEHAASRSADESALVQAKNAVGKARLEMLKNEMLAAILVEKNEQTLAESEANFEMLSRTFDVKRRAERAERRALEIQRDRAREAMQHAQRNIEAMTMRAPHDGMIVLKSVWKMGQMGEVQEGEEVRPGLPLLDVIDPARMRLRTRVNQADAPFIRPGQTASVELEAYPGRTFSARVEAIAPAAVTSVLSPRARWFTATVVIEGADPLLLPDLTAAVDVVLDKQENVLVVPRESLGVGESGPVVHVQSGDAWDATPVTVGAVGDTEAVITKGLQDGAVIRRRPGGGQ